jgi:hypothetical protein
VTHPLVAEVRAIRGDAFRKGERSDMDHDCERPYGGLRYKNHTAVPLALPARVLAGAFRAGQFGLAGGLLFGTAIEASIKREVR